MTNPQRSELIIYIIAAVMLIAGWYLACFKMSFSLVLSYYVTYVRLSIERSLRRTLELYQFYSTIKQ